MRIPDRSRETATLRNDERDDGGSTTSGPKHDRSIRESGPAVFSAEIETAGTVGAGLLPSEGKMGLIWISAELTAALQKLGKTMLDALERYRDACP